MQQVYLARGRLAHSECASRHSLMKGLILRNMANADPSGRASQHLTFIMYLARRLVSSKPRDEAGLCQNFCWLRGIVIICSLLSDTDKLVVVVEAITI